MNAKAIYVIALLATMFLYVVRPAPADPKPTPAPPEPIPVAPDQGAPAFSAPVEAPKWRVEYHWFQGCPPCRRFKALVLSDPRVAQELSKWDYESVERVPGKRNNPRAYPCIRIFTPDGGKLGDYYPDVVDHSPLFRSPEGFVEFLLGWRTSSILKVEDEAI